MVHQLILSAVVLGAASLLGSSTLAENKVTPTQRGAVVETDRYRAEIRDGVLTGFHNKLTNEEYIDSTARLETLVPHLPTGLGTQNTAAERDAAHQLYEWPWWENPHNHQWPNQHYPTAAGDFTCDVAAASAVLKYRGLNNGQDEFADETFTLELAIDPETGDLLVTPAAESPRGGVYGCGLTLATLTPEITIEAPIFEGVRLDRHMQPALWTNQWANFWDYAFVAFNGEKTGAVGLWCQDKDLKVYKTLFYLLDGQGLSLSVQALNIPPFNELKSARPMTWRLQAFDRSWAQAAARFRDWRLKNVKIAPRPEWVKNLSFMAFGMQHADPTNTMPFLERFFEGRNLDRVVTWMPDVRGAGFDRNHANNDPYEGFREDIQKYRAKNLRSMVYLQPMIMWGPDPKTDRQREAVRLAAEANTRSPFLQNNTTYVGLHDQHHLGHAGWQRWFLNWVREYIQGYGADGIYHDQSYLCPIDARGLVDGMTTPQGMADYFYKAATENPNSIHGTEHMTELNNVGASLGLGCGILGGTPGYETKGQIGPAGSMNWQRIKQASPVSNALHSPNGAIFAFPHVSNFWKGPVRFHHGMDQVERRGDLAAISVWEYYGSSMRVPFEFWANEMWLDRQRALLFVRNGLRPAFPEDWDHKVLSYFKGAHGEDFRYEELPWGSAFVQYRNGKRALHYARVQGVKAAAVQGGILGWPCYSQQGPSGLNPSVTYCVNGELRRPPAWFSVPEDADVYVRDGFANQTMAWVELAPLQGSAKGLSLLLSAPRAPAAVWVDGVRTNPSAVGRQWRIPATSTSFVAVLLKEPPAGFGPIAVNLALNRCMEDATRRDFFTPAAFSEDLTQEDQTVTLCGARAALLLHLPKQFQTHIPVKAPTSDGVLRVGPAPGQTMSGTWRINGKPATPGADGVQLRLKAGEPALLSCSSTAVVTCVLEWKP